jgi:hypothetical protein
MFDIEAKGQAALHVLTNPFKALTVDCLLLLPRQCSVEDLPLIDLVLLC